MRAPWQLAVTHWESLFTTCSIFLWVEEEKKKEEKKKGWRQQWVLANRLAACWHISAARCFGESHRLVWRWVFRQGKKNEQDCSDFVIHPVLCKHRALTPETGIIPHPSSTATCKAWSESTARSPESQNYHHVSLCFGTLASFPKRRQLRLVGPKRAHQQEIQQICEEQSGSDIVPTCRHNRVLGAILGAPSILNHHKNQREKPVGKHRHIAEVKM